MFFVNNGFSYLCSIGFGVEIGVNIRIIVENFSMSVVNVVSGNKCLWCGGSWCVSKFDVEVFEEWDVCVCKWNVIFF